MSEFNDIGPVTQLILQSTNFCNLNCSYCYLPNRNDTRKMTVEIASRALETILESGLVEKKIEIRWHSGEPLSTGVTFLDTTISKLNQLVVSSDVRLTHSIQTNGTLISDEFCNLAIQKNIVVGISIDGPKFLHDTYRVNRAGIGSFSNTMKGISKLKKHGVEFEVICVLTTRSLQYPELIYRFFCDIGAKKVGFNLEESEGINVSGTNRKKDIMKTYASFMDVVYKLSFNLPVIIREIEEMELLIINGNENIRNISNVPFSQLTIDAYGRVYTFSPELVGLYDLRYGDFSIGNIMDNNFTDMIQNIQFKKIRKDVDIGVLNCKKNCSYFRVCGGGSPSNKLGENQSFLCTETQHCKIRYQTLAESVLKNLTERTVC